MQDKEIRAIRKKLKTKNKVGATAKRGIPAKYQTVGKKLEKVPKEAKKFRKVIEYLMKKGQSVQVPLGIIEDNNLKPQEKLMLMQICSLSYNRGFCYAGNDTFGMKLNISVRQVSTLIQSLKEKGYIIVNTYAQRNGKWRFVEIDLNNLIKITKRVTKQRKEWLESRRAKDKHVDNYGRSIHSPFWGKENRKRKD